MKGGDVDRIHVQVTPYLFNMVGHPFKIGDTPRVNAQFNIPYCVANAILRGQPKLGHFEMAQITDPDIISFTRKISVAADPSLEQRGHTAARMEIRTKDGNVHRKSLDTASGFPGNPLNETDHAGRFCDCIDYAGEFYEKENGEKIFEIVNNLERVEDVRVLLPLLKAKREL